MRYVFSYLFQILLKMACINLQNDDFPLLCLSPKIPQTINCQKQIYPQMRLLYMEGGYDILFFQIYSIYQ